MAPRQPARRSERRFGVHQPRRRQRRTTDRHRRREGSPGRHRRGVGQACKLHPGRRGRHCGRCAPGDERGPNPGRVRPRRRAATRDPSCRFHRRRGALVVVTSIDPRLRQRRIAVRRAEGRRRLRVLVGIVVLVALAGGGYALSRSAVFDLDTIEIDGAFGVEANQVAEASGLVVGTPMLDLDLGRAAEGIVALPWVRTAAVDRAWPGTVEIAVTRRIGVALLPVGDGSGVVIDAEAVAIARSETVAVGDLPVITLGPVGDLGDVQTLALPALKLIDAMPLDLAPWVETFGTDDAGTGSPLLRLDLVGDVVAIMGDDRDLDTKYDAVRSVLDQVDLAGICEIDVQVGDNPVLKRSPQCAEPVTAALTG
ncbi:MAG: hypothetical protein CL411_08080 [Acidimicrobiaceae bacterium]|nr:hypothetical protein [Acidimicrobiaceae bacterium]